MPIAKSLQLIWAGKQRIRVTAKRAFMLLQQCHGKLCREYEQSNFDLHEGAGQKSNHPRRHTTSKKTATSINTAHLNTASKYQCNSLEEKHLSCSRTAMYLQLRQQLQHNIYQRHTKPEAKLKHRDVILPCIDRGKITAKLGLPGGFDQVYQRLCRLSNKASC